MTTLPNRSVLDGSSNPTTGAMKTALGGMHDFLFERFGVGGINSENTMLGYLAGYGAPEGMVNGTPSGYMGTGKVYIGARAGLNDISGGRNTFVGGFAGYGNIQGMFNTYIGQDAGMNCPMGDENTFLGVGAGMANIGHSHSTAIGCFAQITGANQVQMGGSATTTYVYGTVQNRSDARDKADVRDTVLGLGFINSLRPVDYKLDMRDDYKPEAPDRSKFAETEEGVDEFNAAIEAWLVSAKLDNLIHDGSKKRGRYHHGLIAQEVQALIAETGVDFGGFQDHKLAGGNDVLSIGYDEIIGPLIKAVQELSARVKVLEAELAAL